MARKKLTVVISQGPGKNPTKRQLEEDIATQLMLNGTADVSLIPHLYDLPYDHHGLDWLRSIDSDMVVVSWLYERAARWVLDRNGIPGQVGLTQLPSDEADEDGEEELPVEEATSGIGSVKPLNRKIYVLDLRQSSDSAVYVNEIERIAREATTSLVTLSLGLSLSPAPSPQPAKPAAAPFSLPFSFPTAAAGNGAASPPPAASPEPRRRWYPVIDYSRCTNCMECIDFCLFGVYGVDALDRILVEEQDNCKRGCPACSRVCPANAIIFPEHKTAAIAGAPTTGAGDFKIDLSKLFGAPSALEIAAMERDTELVADGRDAVGLAVGIPKRQADKPCGPQDDLDKLMDGLDALDF